jgi:hypothetical protein
MEIDHKHNNKFFVCESLCVNNCKHGLVRNFWASVTLVLSTVENWKCKSGAASNSIRPYQISWKFDQPFSSYLWHTARSRLKYATERRSDQAHKVRYEVITASSIKMAIFWVVEPCSLVEVCRCFRGAWYLHLHRPVDGGSKNLLNFGKIRPDYTAQQPRK